MKHLRKRSLFSLVFPFLIPCVAFANYRVPAENVELMEDAMSGGAAIAVDASTNFFNPAGITRINQPELVASARFTQTNTFFRGTSVGLRGSTSSRISSLIPAFHYTTPLYDCFYFGISFTSPFGSSTQYPPNSIVRFVTTKSTLLTMDISPSIAYRFNRNFSVGIGPNIQYGSIVANLFFPPPPFPLNSELKNEGFDIAYGWHAGALYELNAGTRIGFNYRSPVSHKFKGNSTWASLENNDLSIKLNLPAVSTLSVYHTFNPAWAVMATIDYTQWSVVRNIIIRNSAVTDIVTIPQNFKNTVRYALGGEYHCFDKWILRAGISYDPTPMNNEDRSVVLPGGNSVIVGMGGHYQWQPNLGVDLGYLHAFVQKVHLNNAVLGTQTVGNATSDINAFGVQVTYDFV